MTTTRFEQQDAKTHLPTRRRRAVGLTLGALLAGSMAFIGGGCNTVEGAGEDVEAAGDAVSDTARDASD